MNIDELDLEGQGQGANGTGSNGTQGGNQQEVDHLDGSHGDVDHLDDNSQGQQGQGQNQNGAQGQQGLQVNIGGKGQGQQNNGDASNGQGTSGFHAADGQQGKQNQENNGQQGDSSSKGGQDNIELTAGQQIEFDGKTYTVAENGNIVDDKGNIFKEAKDVKSWLATVMPDNNDNSNAQDNKDNKEVKGITLAAIQEALGIDVTDKDGKPIEFTDDASGIKAYVDDVIQLRENEIRQAAVNKLYQDNPILKQFDDYLTLNNGDPRGFGQIPDRSTVKLDKDNQVQQEAIIRMAAQEFGNKSIDENYIKYLKDTGGLYDVAKSQLAALQDKDKKVRADIAARAEEQRKQEDEAINKYWNHVSDVIKGRNIGGYKLPESFVKEVNGTKVTLTPDDFYDYLYKPVAKDEDGRLLTGYQRDLNSRSDDDALNDEMLNAWLLFTGGSINDLVKLKINEDNVRKLKLRSQEAKNSRVIKFVSKQKKNVDFNDIILQ